MRSGDAPTTAAISGTSPQRTSQRIQPTSPIFRRFLPRPYKLLGENIRLKPATGSSRSSVGVIALPLI